MTRRPGKDPQFPMSLGNFQACALNYGRLIACCGRLQGTGRPAAAGTNAAVRHCLVFVCFPCLRG